MGHGFLRAAMLILAMSGGSHSGGSDLVWHFPLSTGELSSCSDVWQFRPVLRIRGGKKFPVSKMFRINTKNLSPEERIPALEKVFP